MKITQISVFLENRKGRLFDVCSLLAENNIDIIALTIAETEDFGVLRLIVNKPEKTSRLLAEKGFVASETKVVIAAIDDHPGGLAGVLGVLNREEVNIEYMHAFLSRKSKKAYMVFRFENPDTAIKILEEGNITILREQDVVE